MRNKFSLSYTKLFSCDLGELVPCGVMEVLPGDSMQQATTALLRCSPLLAPVMHPVNVRVHHWYVPYRLIWDDFEDFITGGPDGADDSVYPTITLGNVSVGTLADYLGCPLKASALTVSALPFRAYDMVFNEFYRDEDLQTEIPISTASGDDNTTETLLRTVNWEKDYFTASRPWEQKGPDITLPLGTSAPVSLLAGTGTMKVKNAATRANANSVPSIGSDATADFNNGGTDYVLDPNGQLIADLSAASAVSINTLREALALQRFQEARARFGSRYTEYLRYLGVHSSDSRLQRPEYLGGGSNTVQFSEVLQTAEGTDPVGQMRGHGISAMRSNRYRRYFEEHGIVISMLSARPKTIYQQGLARMWNRRTKEDFWQKELEAIGQQQILNKEIYVDHATPEGTFGYQDRYDEYRRNESCVSGEFRTVLNHWHMAREFSSDPALNSSFVQCVPTERTFAVPGQDVLWIMAKHSVQARRMVAKTGRSFTF